VQLYTTAETNTLLAAKRSDGNNKRDAFVQAHKKDVGSNETRRLAYYIAIRVSLSAMISQVR
jgi:hypothetical protein